jgi:hypothetical protein
MDRVLPGLLTPERVHDRKERNQGCRSNLVAVTSNPARWTAILKTNVLQWFRHLRLHKSVSALKRAASPSKRAWRFEASCTQCLVRGPIWMGEDDDPPRRWERAFARRDSQRSADLLSRDRTAGPNLAKRVRSSHSTRFPRAHRSSSMAIWRRTAPKPLNG